MKWPRWHRERTNEQPAATLSKADEQAAIDQAEADEDPDRARDSLARIARRQVRRRP